MRNQLQFIDVAGDPYNRGVQIGQASKRQIAHSLLVYRQTFEFCDIPWQLALKKAPDYQPLVESSYPELLAGIKWHDLNEVTTNRFGFHKTGIGLHRRAIRRNGKFGIMGQRYTAICIQISALHVLANSRCYLMSY